MIDLRSDTVTRPSAAMREAIAAAEVGDDDYGDDLTTLELQERTAALLGKEAGLFVPSGVMSNLIAALTHCPDDRRVLALTNSHIVWSLTAQPRIARLVNLTTMASDDRGVPTPEALHQAVDSPGAPGDPDALPPGVVCFENTHNLAGGTALTPAETAPVIDTAQKRGLPVHLDGARLFNAAVALDLPLTALTEGVDSVTVCVSKGLGGPIGSVLCGTTAFIDQARDYRKFLGGTMRQVGLVAAAGLYALDHGIDRLAEDHANARWFADQLAAIPGIRVIPRHPDTNLIYIEHETIDSNTFAAALEAGGLALNHIDTRIRFVTHLDLTRDDLARAVEIVAAASG